MPKISASIELYDNFSNTLNDIISSVQIATQTMQNLSNDMNADVDTSVFDNMQTSVDKATMSVRRLDDALNKLSQPKIQTPAPVNTTASITWQSEKIPTFTNTGIERFQLEIQNTNSMLDQLGNTQSAIIQQARSMDIFSPAAKQDISQMLNRIQAIRSRIEAIEKNPINIGTDKANNELEQLRSALSRAVEEQRQLNIAVEQMDVTKANEAYLRLSNTIGNTEKYIRDNTTAQGEFNSSLEEGQSKANGLMGAVKGAILAYASIQTVKAVTALSDDITSMTARLNLMNDGLQTTEELQNMIFASAERARGSYLGTADAVSKLGLMAGDAFSSSEEIVAFTEQLNKQFTIAGTSAEGIDAAMLQLTQAMGSGILRGEEYNSVLEQAPNIIQAIADYMNVPKGQLKDMAAEGVITAEIVKNALFAAADETNRKFESMPMTFSQAWQSFENRSIKIFEPVLKQLNRIVNNDNFEKMVDGIMKALSVLAVTALIVFNVLANVGGFVADNWSIIAPIIYLVAAALGVYYGRLVALWALEKARFVFQKTQKAVEIALAVAAYGLATARGVEASATASATVAQLGLNAAMYACPITWIIAGIAVIIAIFYVAVAIVNKFAGTSVSATGLIAGAFGWLGATIANTFIGLQNVIAAFVNFFANVFLHPILSVKMAFLDLMTFITNIVRHAVGLIESLINLIPGVEVDLTSKIEAQISWMQNERQATLEQGQYKEYMKPLEYRDPNEAFNRWYDKGADFTAGKNVDVATPDVGQYSLDAITNSVGTIAENTSQTADNTAMTDEDLKYMRDIAEQEVINRYTTAEINVDMSGMQNTVNNNGDLDGFMSGLTDAVNEAAESMAEGTHE